MQTDNAITNSRNKEMRLFVSNFYRAISDYK